MTPLVVIVLAAGRGQRFLASGGRLHKLDAPLAGRPVLEHVLSAVRAAGLAWHVVRAADGDGMGDSIAAGVRATASASGWLILPGDLPLIQAETLQQVAAQLSTHPVVVPWCQNRHGHPVGFDACCFTALAGLAGDRGAASVVKAHRQRDAVRDLHLDDIGVLTDIDTVDDLARAEQLLAARPRRRPGAV